MVRINSMTRHKPKNTREVIPLAEGDTEDKMREREEVCTALGWLADFLSDNDGVVKQ